MRISYLVRGMKARKRVLEVPKPSRLTVSCGEYQTEDAPLFFIEAQLDGKSLLRTLTFFHCSAIAFPVMKT